ncbi:breakpoint cluster region protein-like [Delphinapterus leucas]|uniref:Breakpoint cluster region protein-like n=1 Tax=Delphinapterus leucas TaxID=9749 RepID=A0A2Y9PXF0_DELLE|nr:breakpoint cluster region protein-like [Delphinapterus leucas]
MWDPQDFERHWQAEFPGEEAPVMRLDSVLDMERELERSKLNLKWLQQVLAEEKFKVGYLQAALEKRDLGCGRLEGGDGDSRGASAEEPAGPGGGAGAAREGGRSGRRRRRPGPVGPLHGGGREGRESPLPVPGPSHLAQGGGGWGRCSQLDRRHPPAATAASPPLKAAGRLRAPRPRWHSSQRPGRGAVRPDPRGAGLGG